MNNTLAHPRSSQRCTPVYQPRYRVRSADDHYAVSVELPGVDKDKIDARFDDQVLTIEARRERSAPDGWRALHTESPAGTFRLQLEVQAEVDRERFSARYADGVLTLTLPKAPELQPRQITVE